MPIDINIEKKQIVRNPENLILINAYKEALALTGQPPDPALDKDNARKRTGIMPNVLIPIWELLSNQEHGSKVTDAVMPHSLPDQKIKFDVSAETLLREYTAFLNNLLLTQKVSMKEIDKNPIESKYVVTYELLYRLVVSVLCKETYECDYKIKMLEALNRFIDHPALRDILVERPMFGTEHPSTFIIILKDDYTKWAPRFTQMIDMNYMIHINQIAINHSINNLKKIEQATQAHIIAAINPDEEKEAFRPRWLDSTQKRVENELVPLADNKDLMLANINNIDHKRIEYEKSIITKLRSRKGQIYSEKVESLYAFQRDTHRLQEVLLHLDSVMNFTAWIAILLDIFNFDKLSILISDHYQTCNARLTFPQEIRMDRCAAKSGLLMYQTADLQVSMKHNLGEFRGLQNIEVKQFIKDSLCISINALVNLQKQYVNTRYHFINVNQLRQGGLLALTQTDNNQQLSEEDQNIRMAETLNNLADENKLLVERVESLEAQVVSYSNDNNRNLSRNQNLTQEIIQDTQVAQIHLNQTLEEIQKLLADEMRFLRQNNLLLRNAHTEYIKINSRVSHSTSTAVLLYRRFSSNAARTAELLEAITNKAEGEHNRRTIDHLDYLEFLKNQGANIFARAARGTYSGYSALHIAVERENLLACIWLLNQMSIQARRRFVNSAVSTEFSRSEARKKNEGAFTRQDEQLESPLDIASRQKQTQIISLLKAYDAESSYIKQHTQKLHEILSDTRIKHDEDINSTSSETSTYCKQLEDLIARGADIDSMGADGNTPLHKLLLIGNQTLLIFIINAGANLHVMNKAEITPLRYWRQESALNHQINSKNTEKFLHSFCPEFFQNPDDKPAERREINNTSIWCFSPSKLH